MSWHDDVDSLTASQQGTGASVWSRRAGLDVITWPALDELGVQAVVTSREGGLSDGPYRSLNLGLHVGDDPSAVLGNRARAAASIGLELDDLVFSNQAHGRVVVEVTRTDRGRGARSQEDAVPSADALVTRDAGVGLVVMVADCVPIVLFDPATSTLGCVHAGWRGTLARVVEAAIAAMQRAGARSEDLVAGLGPAIPPERYQVGDDVAEAARCCFGDDVDDVLTPDGTGRWRFDLWRANRRLLRDAGVPDDNVLSAELPTGQGTAFFSNRAQRPCGRFALLAQIQRGSSQP